MFYSRTGQAVLWAVPLFLFHAVNSHPTSAEPNTMARQSFDVDPQWDAFRNRLLPDPLPVVKQDFGYRDSHFASGQAPGEIGGIVHRAHPRAYYAKAIRPMTLQDSLSASGKFAVTRAGGGSGVLIGWFNHEKSQGWRTPSSLAFRIDGNGGKYWVFYEYGTIAWGTGGGGAYEGERYQTTPTRPFPADGSQHTWSLEYDPDGADGQGQIDLRIDDRTYSLPLRPGHKQQGAIFDRFGIWNQQTAGGALELYLDDLKIGKSSEPFDRDPGWVREGNPVTFRQRVIRPYHNFGFSQSSYAGGKAGEIGGIVFRDERPMYYADRIGPFSLDDDLAASGKIVLKSAGADSALSIGWFGSDAKRKKNTPEHEKPQTDYIGIYLEGPSRIGHYFRAAYSTSQGAHHAPTFEGTDEERPVIRPNGEVHPWSLRYSPDAADGRGRITVTFDDTTHRLDLKEGERAAGATLDRFGVFNTQSGGHHVEVYIDDVTYSK